MTTHTPITTPNIDLSELKQIIADNIDKHINTVINEVVSACNVFKESHDHMCNLPIVKNIYNENVSLCDKIHMLEANMDSFKTSHINYVNDSKEKMDNLLIENTRIKEQMEKFKNTKI